MHYQNTTIIGWNQQWLPQIQCLPDSVNTFSVFQNILELVLPQLDSEPGHSFHGHAAFVFLWLGRAPSSLKPLIFFFFMMRIKQGYFCVLHSRFVRLFSRGIISLVSRALTIPYKTKVRSTFLAIIFSRNTSCVKFRYLTFQPIRKCLVSVCCVISDAKFNHLVRVVTADHLGCLASIDETCRPQQSDWGWGCRRIMMRLLWYVLTDIIM